MIPSFIDKKKQAGGGNADKQLKKDLERLNKYLGGFPDTSCFQLFHLLLSRILINLSFSWEEDTSVKFTGLLYYLLTAPGVTHFATNGRRDTERKRESTCS